MEDINFMGSDPMKNSLRKYESDRKGVRSPYEILKTEKQPGGNTRLNVYDDVFYGFSGLCGFSMTEA